MSYQTGAMNILPLRRARAYGYSPGAAPDAPPVFYPRGPPARCATIRVHHSERENAQFPHW